MPRTLIALMASLLLAGCANLNSLSNDVSSYSQWPADRKPAGYAFERLPSQQSQPEAQAQLEAAARPALAAAGFQPAAEGSEADVTVQIGVRIQQSSRGYWDDPFYWHGSLWYGWGGPRWRGSMWWGGPMYWGPPPTYYSREVAVLIRDRRTGATLYETRAVNDGNYGAIESLLPAMFAAAMKDFPAPAISPRRVVTPLAAAS